ncbi:hypothetical protein OOU_Y34scaffold00773g19 [Pyricularia oryzae Y34]|uniref:Uncharacterized protein n=3 Tax=Pyricularia oryzae TaxID=318829 RepID=A0A4P7N7N0_PYROR|nr:hypothetical protein OOU_Y34scaffold00773g19 [Pyricularia oryzae Y34]QBZ57231.1 hypothetical protein PoMZ_02155 [Pyricularia oryzae]
MDLLKPARGHGQCLIGDKGKEIMATEDASEEYGVHGLMSGLSHQCPWQ